MQVVIHETTFATDLHQLGVFHDFEVVRDCHEFGVEEAGEVGNGQFTCAKCIDDPQSVRIAECFESFSAEVSAEGICRSLFHGNGPLGGRG